MHRFASGRWQPRVPWRWLVVALFLQSVAAGCARPPGMSEGEKAVLQQLADHDAQHEIDEKFRVTKLALEGRHVTDAELEEIAKLPYLRKLSLQKTSVTDAGLLKVCELKRLENLGITDTLVTDRGLTYLEKMVSLQNVWVTQNKRLTVQGIEALRRALPRLNVHVMNRSKKGPAQEKKVKEGV
jgi:hypothetical protein